MGRHPRWLSAEDRRILRDASDQRSRYNESIGSADVDGNPSTVSSGEGRRENELLSGDNN